MTIHSQGHLENKISYCPIWAIEQMRNCHETHDEVVKVNVFCVVHGARMQDDVCIVPPWAMVAPAPPAYSW